GEGRGPAARDEARDGAAGGSRAGAPRQGHQRRGRAPGVGEAGPGRAHHRHRAGGHPAAVPADGHGDRLREQLHDDLPAAARPVPRIFRQCDQAGGRAGAAGEGIGRGAPGAAAQDGSRRLAMAGELIGREALERIIQRAAELQAGEQDIGEGLTEPELLALGQDVGIPSRYLRQALLEEQTRPPVEARGGLLAWLIGPARLSAQRVVAGEPADVDGALGAWMQQEELLQVKRRYVDHTTWEPKVGAFASIQRALGSGGRRFALTRAAEVAGRVTPLESGFCHVQLVADVRNGRRQRLGGTATVLGLGTAATSALWAMGLLAPFPFLPLLILAPAAAAILRSHRAQDEHVGIGLEQVLDRRERGEAKAEHALAGPNVTPFVPIA